MNRKQREIKRNELAKKYEGIALMSSSFVEREYEKVFSFENKTFSGILEFLKDFDIFDSGLQNLSFESELDPNGYYTKMYIRFTHEGEALVGIHEGGFTILEEKSFDSNEELSFILNSSQVKRKVGLNTSLSNVSFYTDPLFDDILEERFSNK